MRAPFLSVNLPALHFRLLMFSTLVPLPPSLPPFDFLSFASSESRAIPRGSASCFGACLDCPGCGYPECRPPSWVRALRLVVRRYGHFMDSSWPPSPRPSFDPLTLDARHGNREETVRRMRERSRAPPNSLPPLLRRWRGGVGIKVVLSAEELGKIKSIDLSVVAGDVNIQVGRRRRRRRLRARVRGVSRGACSHELPYFFVAITCEARATSCSPQQR